MAGSRRAGRSSTRRRARCRQATPPAPWSAGCCSRSRPGSGRAAFSRGMRRQASVRAASGVLSQFMAAPAKSIAQVKRSVFEAASSVLVPPNDEPNHADVIGADFRHGSNAIECGQYVGTLPIEAGGGLLVVLGRAEGGAGLLAPTGAGRVSVAAPVRQERRDTPRHQQGSTFGPAHVERALLGCRCHGCGSGRGTGRCRAEDRDSPQARARRT